MDHTGVDICYRHEVLGDGGGCRFRHDRQGTPLEEGWKLIDDPDHIYMQTRTLADIDPNDGNRTLVSLSIPEEDVVNPGLGASGSSQLDVGPDDSISAVGIAKESRPPKPERPPPMT
eukprot:8196629-Karenia_brevis.AAC.1